MQTLSRQQRYRARLPDAGRVAMQVTVSTRTADLIKSIAAERAIPLGAALEAKLQSIVEVDRTFVGTRGGAQ